MKNFSKAHLRSSEWPIGDAFVNPFHLSPTEFEGMKREEERPRIALISIRESESWRYWSLRYG